MRFLIILNSAPFFSPFALNFAQFIASHSDHEVLLYLTSMCAEQALNERIKPIYNHNIKIIRRNEISETSELCSVPESLRFSWKELYPSWDRKVLHYRTLKGNSGFLSESFSYTARLLFTLMKNHNPDIILQEPPANLITFLAKRIADFLRIKYFGLLNSRLPGRLDIFDDWFTNSDYTQSFSKQLDEEQADYYSSMAIDFAQQRLIRDYSNLFHNTAYRDSFLRHYWSRLTATGMNRFQLFLAKQRLVSSWDYESLAALASTIKMPIRTIKRKLNYKHYTRRLSKPDESFLRGKDYYVFPMHFQPEASTSAQASYFCDLQNTIRNISFSLPFSSSLLVKEHPHAVGLTPRAFYKSISLLPNCQIISPFTDNTSLLNNSRGVITLTSTLGLQAAILGKPVFTLGDVFYDFHPNVRKISGFDELNNLLLNEQFRPFQGKALQKHNAKFFFSYYHNSVDASINDFDSNGPANFSDLLEKLMRKCEK